MKACLKKGHVHNGDNPQKKNTIEIQQGGANMASLLAREESGGGRKLISDVQLTATSICEKAEGQVEKEDQ